MSSSAENLIGLVVEEKTAIILQENRLRVFGDRNAHVFLKSRDQRTVTWHQLEPGVAGFLVDGDAGPMLELDSWRTH